MVGLNFVSITKGHSLSDSEQRECLWNLPGVARNALCLCGCFSANLVRMLTMSAFGVVQRGIKFMTNVCVHC